MTDVKITGTIVATTTTMTTVNAVAEHFVAGINRRTTRERRRCLQSRGESRSETSAGPGRDRDISRKGGQNYVGLIVSR